MLKQPGKAMIHSSRRDRKTKAIAEVLAMIADAHPPLAPLRPCPVLEIEEWLWESATEFCAAYAERAMQITMIRAPFSGRVRRYPAFRGSQNDGTALARFMA